MKFSRIVALFTLCTASLCALIAAESPSAAIVVVNRAGPEFDDKLPIVEDFITAKVSEAGLRIISPEAVINAARSLHPETADSARPTDSLESSLTDNASVIRLAQGLNADYLLFASILGFNEQKREINAYGNQLSNYTYTLRLSYKLLDASTGASVTGGIAKAVRTEQNTINSNIGTVQSPLTSTTVVPHRSAYDADTGLVNTVRRYEKAVGLVAFALKDGRLVGNGTAWAVAPDTFATNAHVSGPVNEVISQGGAAYVVLNKHPESKFRVTKAITDSRYMSAQRAANGRQPFPNNYDVGLLKIDGRTDVWLPLAPDAELQKIDSGYRIAFLGFPMEGLVGGGVNVDSPVATMQSGIITSNTDWWMSKGDASSRLLIQHNLASTGGASGSPIFNPQGQVVALLNAGNIIGQVSMTPKGPEVIRAPSAALVNFGQRVDILRALLQSTGISPTSSPASTGPADSGPAPKPRVTFTDPQASSFVDDLLDDATSQLAQSIRTSLASGNVAVAKTGSKDAQVTIKINVEVTGIALPNVTLKDDHTLVFGEGTSPLVPSQVNIEIDGVSVGTAPGEITLRKGFSNIRLTHSGLQPWHRVINAVDGQTLTASLQLTDKARKQWKDYTDYLYALQKDNKLTDAQVQLLQAKAKMLSQSGFKVDTKEAPKSGDTVIVR